MADHSIHTCEFRHIEQISTTDEMGEFIDRITGMMSKSGFTEKEVFSVRLGLEEAVVNAIRHGNQGDINKTVLLRYAVDSEMVIVQVEDQGDGFDPSQLPDPLAPENLERPCGRGVFLMGNYMTWIKYNDKGNCVTLYKERAR